LTDNILASQTDLQWIGVSDSDRSQVEEKISKYLDTLRSIGLARQQFTQCRLNLFLEIYIGRAIFKSNTSGASWFYESLASQVAGAIFIDLPVEII
jgi:hypothetical protein